MSTAILSLPAQPVNERPSSIRRRNALVPLPLLPPVPRNAIVTSVKIVHNPTPPSPTAESPSSSNSSSTASSPEEETSTEIKRSVKRSPTSPTQTSFYFAPLTKRPRHSKRRSGSRSPKCSPPNSPTSPPGSRQYFPAVVAESVKPSVPEAVKEEPKKEEVKVKVENNDAAAALRRPRSTILVTVRLASPPAQSAETNPFDTLPPPPPSLPPTPVLRHKKPLASLSARKPRLLSIQSRPQHAREPASPTLSRMKSPTSSINAQGFGRHRANAYIPPPPPPVPVKPKWNKPRVSSALVTSAPVVAHFEELEETMEVDQPRMPSLYPATGILRNASSLNLTTPSRPITPLPRKTKKGGKTGSRIAMLRWALLNHSGPEVGRRIQAMGVRLAREIWEAERFAEEEDDASGAVMLTRGTRQMSGVIVASPTREESMVMESAKEDEESVLPTLTDEDDEMPVIEDVMEHLGISEMDDGERERIVEECIRELEEEMESQDMDVDEEMEMVDPSLDRKMVDSIVSDSIKGNADEGRALSLEAAEDMEAKAEVCVNDSATIVEDVEMVDHKEEGEKVSSNTSLTSRTTSPPTQTIVNRDISLLSGRRASLATDKLVELNGIPYTRRRSSLGLSEDKMPIIMAARKWFGKTAL